ncbi:MAG: hypothetical protein JNJ83_10755 [Verrucomicrobiaceae bacterium]|nr:hypothetical protein [Verrucomicrobiaceae bacterium]
MPNALAMPFSNEAGTGEPRVVPVKLLVLIVCLSLLGSYLLVPDQSQLVERLMMDQQYSRIQDMLRSSLGNEDGVDAESLQKLGSERLASLSNLLRLTPREQVQTIFAAGRPLTYDRFTHAVTLAAVKYVDVMTPEQAWALIGKQVDRIPPGYLADLTSVLAHNALATGKPDVAARVLAKSAELPQATPVQAREMVQAFRWSGKAAEGALHLRRWLEARPDLASSLSPDMMELRDLGLQVALEGGSPGDALDFQIMGLKAIPQTTAISEPQIKVAMSLATQSSRTGDVVPWLKRFIEGLPEHKLDWRSLPQQKVSSPDKFATYATWLTKYAQYSDWSSGFDTAFDAHFRLAACGEVPSLDRCLALADFLGRIEELADLLQFTSITDQRPELQPKLAAFLANLGRDEEALPIYQKWVTDHPEDAEAAHDLGCLLEDMGREEDALLAFANAVKVHPEHVASIKKLAESCIRAGKHANALQLYAGLPEKAHDHATLENYALLAESLDQHDQLFRAQVLTTRQTDVTTVEPYLAIAETASYLENPEPAIAELEKGLQRFPSSPALRVAIGTVWLRDLTNPERCYAALKHDSVKQSFEGVTLLIEIGALLPNPPDLLAFLGSDIENKFSLPPQSRLELAVLSHRCGDVARAERLFATVPEEGRGLAYLAEAKTQLGELDDAIRLMNRYLEGNSRATSEDWIALGELFEQTGRADEADHAFQQSLTLLTSDLPDTKEAPTIKSTQASEPASVSPRLSPATEP